MREDVSLADASTGLKTGRYAFKRLTEVLAGDKTRGNSPTLNYGQLKVGIAVPELIEK
ncbi:MAG: hypothetical protein Q7R66_10060 [Undibacterium sp.]|uniref:hypothetical protein n=1 Tax=Undibacterium sp. TaxID=1914977 RepID=UPI002719ADA1|nr:hypothetical protein [Undibacterium sp.]MDO8652523.1 hypothetical protein [Undibacterium sp.]